MRNKHGKDAGDVNKLIMIMMTKAKITDILYKACVSRFTT